MSKRILNQTATIEQRTATDDLAGGQDYVWSDRHTGVKGSLQPTSAIEAGRWDREAASERYNWYMRYLSEIVATDRLLLGSTYYDITGVENLGGLDKWLRLSVEKHE